MHTADRLCRLRPAIAQNLHVERSRLRHLDSIAAVAADSLVRLQCTCKFHFEGIECSSVRPTDVPRLNPFQPSKYVFFS